MTEFVHVAVIDKFLPEFVDFMKTTFEDFESRHKLVVVGADANYGLRPAPNIEFVQGKVRRIALWRVMRNAKTIFLHGLFDKGVREVLLARREMLDRCCWLIWGGELYDGLKSRRLADVFDYWSRKFVIRNVGSMAGYIEGDFQYARSQYLAKADQYECLLYPSNVFTGSIQLRVPQKVTRILLGNSATESNNHLEVLERLSTISWPEGARLLAPLSYGNPEYGQVVQRRGRELLGDRFSALTEFIARDRYLELLDEIDTAIFFHSRQQALGNIIQLLGRGKKVYLNSQSPIWPVLVKLGLQVYDARDLNFEPIEHSAATANARIVAREFSIDMLGKQWRLMLARLAKNWQ